MSGHASGWPRFDGFAMTTETDTVFTTIADHALEIRRFAGSGGSTATPTIIFLHEGLGSAGQWRDYPAKVCAATGCPGLAYSRVGYGGSAPCSLPRKTGYMHTEAREFLPALVRQFDLKDIVLYGHSDGASIALIYAADAGQSEASPPQMPRLRGVVVEAPHVMVEEISVAAIERAVDAYESGDLRQRLARHHGANVDHAFYGWADIWRLPAFLKWSLTADIHRLAAPILAIQGRGDPYGSLAQLQAIRENVAGTYEELILPDCGHAPHREKTQATLAAACQFISKCVLT